MRGEPEGASQSRAGVGRVVWREMPVERARGGVRVGVVRACQHLRPGGVRAS